MRDGRCPRCGGSEVYQSIGAEAQSGVAETLFLRLYTDRRWVPDIALLPFDQYVCLACGFCELYVRDLAGLAALPTTTNWRKVE